MRLKHSWRTSVRNPINYCLYCYVYVLNHVLDQTIWYHLEMIFLIVIPITSLHFITKGNVIFE
jgi:hypothetical protein